MSTKTLGWLVGAGDGKKLGSCWDPVNSIPTLSQPGPFQTFAKKLPQGWTLKESLPEGWKAKN